jgi:hypothetical protein
MKNLAPILLFTYNRPHHTRQTVEALQKNHLAQESQLFIYSDAPKNQVTEAKVKEVRQYLKTIDGFKKVTIIEREKNWGLANSIIDGVTQIVNEYGKVIILEDDLITSPYFLKFMNEALEFYEDKKKVWHVSSWNYPIDRQGLSDTFLWRIMNCWGWATWADRWQYFEKDVNKTISEFSKDDIKKFDLDSGSGFWSQVIANKEERINSWAIFWYVTIFKKDGLCLNSTQPFVKNIGHDGSGVHCGNCDLYSDNLLAHQPILFFEKQIIENSIAIKRIRAFFQLQKKPLHIKAINKFKKIIKKIIDKNK